MRKELTIVVIAAALAVAPLPAHFVEAWYVHGVYPAVQQALTGATNRVPFVVLDWTILVAALAFAAASLRDIRRLGFGPAALRGSRRAVVLAAAVYIVFAAAWGFNYRRERLAARLDYDAGRVSAASALRLASATVDRLNALHGDAHAQGWPSFDDADPRLADAFARTIADFGGPSIVTARPKRSLMDWYFRRAGVGGMTDPLFLETLVAGNLLPFERPFIVAHEWSHLAGLTHEGEANLAGWLVCLRGTPAHQYSGWLFMYGEALGAVPAPDRAAVASKLAPGPRADLVASRDRLARDIDPRISAAGWRVYDSYLKVNRVESGARSYDEVVRLALGLKIAQVY